MKKRNILEDAENDRLRIQGDTNPRNYTGRKVNPKTGEMELGTYPEAAMYGGKSYPPAADAQLSFLKAQEKIFGDLEVDQIKKQEAELVKDSKKTESKKQRKNNIEENEDIELSDLLSDPEFRDIVLNLLHRINTGTNDLDQISGMFPESATDKWLNKKLSEWIYKD